MIRFAAALLSQLAAAAPSSQCTAPGAPLLDHAIIAVRDLDRAAAAFRSAGFRIKAGRLHANGLLNRHVKFPDGSEIELMTVQGAPRDAMAQDYADLIAGGDGGVYLALKVSDIAPVARHAAALRLPTRRSSSGPWQFLSFPSESSAAAVFFSAGTTTVTDADSVFRHVPRVDRLAEVWLEGDAALGALLERLGARECDTVPAPDGRSGRRWALGRGHVVLVPPRPDARPRLLGAVLETAGASRNLVRPVPEFWVWYR